MNAKMISIVAIVLIVIVGCAVFFMNSGSSDKDDDTAKATDVPCDPYTFTDLNGTTFTMDHHLGAVAVQWSLSGGPFVTMSILLGEDIDRYLVGIDNCPADYRADMWAEYCEVYPDLKSLENYGAIDEQSFDSANVLLKNPSALITSLAQKSSVESSGVAEAFQKANIPIIYIDFHTEDVDKICQSVTILGKLFGKEKIAEELTTIYADKTNAVLDKVQSILDSGTERPVVYYESTMNGYETMGNSNNNQYQWGMVVYKCGGTMLTDGSAKKPKIESSEVIAKDPEYILFCGSYWPASSNYVNLGFMATQESAQKEMDAYFTHRTGWSELTSYKEGKVYGIAMCMCRDIYDFAAFEYIAKMLFPEEFSDIDPDKDLADFFDKYMPFKLTGCFFTAIR